MLRVVVGGVLAGGASTSSRTTGLGDGVNVDDTPIQSAFPYVAPAQDGRNSRHIDPGEPGCATCGSATCPIN